MWGRVVGVNEKHRRFVDSYLTHGVAERAAIEAGYSEVRARRTGSDLLRNPAIASAIRKAQDERAERMGITADWIVERARETFEKAFAGAPKFNRGEALRHPETGELVMEWSPSGAVSSLNTLAKVLGIGQPQRVEHDHSGEVVYTLRVDQRPAAFEIGEAE